jgi:hypothetical protein
MKPASQKQGNSILPITLRNSMLQAPSNIAESPVLPGPMTNTSPEAEAEAVQRRRRLRMILTSVIAVIDGEDVNPAIAVIDGEDVNPTKPSSSHQRPPQ